MEGDCFPSDKNHLAPSEEPASRNRTAQEQNGTAHRSRAPFSGTASVLTARRGGEATRGSKAISGFYLTAGLMGFVLYFHKEKKVNTGNK